MLDDRWAPATLVSPTQVTYQDLDGDMVRVTFSKPILTSPAVANGVFSFATGSVDNSNAAVQQLWEIDLTSAAGAGGTDITIGVDEPAIGGDGKVHVGFINAEGRDLGRLTVAGDLGRIRAGNDTLSTPALRALLVDSIGVKFFNTQPPGSDLHSILNGPVGKIVTTGNIVDAAISVTSENGRLGLLQIGGSLLGGGASHRGYVLAHKSIGTVRVDGNIVGGAGVLSGFLGAVTGFGDITIGGSLTGGSGRFTGRIETGGGIRSVTIGGNVSGASGLYSGSISARGNIGAVAVSGSLIGGAGSESGRINSSEKIANLLIGGDVDGTSTGGEDAGSIVANKIGRALVGGDVIGGGKADSGQVFARGRISSVTVNGSVVGGARENSGGLYGMGSIGMVTINGSLVDGDGDQAGWIFSRGSIGAVNITGQILGGSLVSEFGNLGSVSVGAIVGFPGQRVLISAGGLTGDPLAGIGRLSVLGSIHHADILAGYRGESFATLHLSNINVRVGRVDVGGNWIASNLVAGIARGADGHFGTADDGNSGFESNGVVSRIGSITIGGLVNGTTTTGDHFGIVAERVGKLSIGGNLAALTPNARNDVVELPTQSNTNDFTLREVKA
jgi:hypothetical protein